MGGWSAHLSSFSLFIPRAASLTAHFPFILTFIPISLRHPISLYPISLPLHPIECYTHSCLSQSLILALPQPANADSI